MAAFYNLHDFLKIKVEEGKLGLAGGYDNYLRVFRKNQIDGSFDYEVREFLEFHPSDKHSSFCLPKEKYAVVFDGDKITEYTTYANRATNLWLQVLILKRGLSFVHGAGAEINCKGIIFPALGGVGKTTLMSELRKLDNFKFFGDDYVIIDKQGKMYSYPSDFSIYDYHLPVFKELQNTAFSRYLRTRKIFWPFYFFKRAVNFIVRRFTSSGAPFFTSWGANYVKVPASVLIPENKMGRETSLTAGLLLGRYNGDKMKIEEIVLNQITEEVVNILNFEFSGGLKYLQALSATNLFSMADFEKNQREVISQCFSKIKRYRISIPRNAELSGYYLQIIDFINKITT